MKKRWIAAVLAGMLLLTGCSQNVPVWAEPDETDVQEDVQETLGAVPPDGNPEDVTCKGSYAGEGSDAQVVARVGNAELTNGQLRAFYWAAAAQYRSEGAQVQPNYDADLSRQPCPLDESVASWEQYFLKQALEIWHTSQALALQGEDEGVPTEEAYQPNLENHEKYLTGMPATQYLYGYYDDYHPNTMHQEYLDNLDSTLAELARERGYTDGEDMARQAFGTSLEDLEDAAALYNWGYMYFTTLSYDLEPTQEEVEQLLSEAGTLEQDPDPEDCCVDVRHILLIPEGGEDETVQIAQDGTIKCSEEAWEQCLAQAEALLKTWKNDSRKEEAAFADIAYKESQDSGTALDGGAYHRLKKGELIEPLDSWCFDPERQSGDTGILRSEYGVHVLYFSACTSIAQVQAEDALTAQMQEALLQAAREAYPMEVTYSAIVLTQGDAAVSLSDVLYPDVAHERFPEVPLYLQQDYGATLFGGFKLATNGCGITSFAMISSYLTDEEWTPPELCEKYGYYSFRNGTDGMIFINEPPVLGYYLKEKTYDSEVAKQALAEGHIVVSIQHKGYWTGGGHYIVLEKLNEDGTVQVRDSNLYNYSEYKVPAHAQDRHEWKDIVAAGSGYWIFEYKVTRIPLCARCGEPEEVAPAILTGGYCCPKCGEALLRRQVYLSLGMEGIC